MSRPRRRRSIPRWVWPVLMAVVFIGVLFVAVFPTQTYLSQRAEAESKTSELRAIEARNAKLEARIEDLRDPDHIELLAREQFGLVYPGEEAYAIVPEGQSGTPVPDVWPLNRLQDRLGN